MREHNAQRRHTMLLLAHIRRHDGQNKPLAQLHTHSGRPRFQHICRGRLLSQRTTSPQRFGAHHLARHLRHLAPLHTRVPQVAQRTPTRPPALSHPIMVQSPRLLGRLVLLLVGVERRCALARTLDSHVSSVRRLRQEYARSLGRHLVRDSADHARRIQLVSRHYIATTGLSAHRARVRTTRQPAHDALRRLHNSNHVRGTVRVDHVLQLSHHTHSQ